jgi:uncharacterized DUF497 family protein
VDRPEFDWDEANIAHLAAHRVTPEEAEQVILDPHSALVETDVVNGEERVRAVGITSAGRILVVVFTERRVGIRPISGWDASDFLQKAYLEQRR